MCLFINIIFSYLKSNIILYVFLNVTTMLLWKRGNLISSRAPVHRGVVRLERIHQDPLLGCKDHRHICWEHWTTIVHVFNNTIYVFIVPVEDDKNNFISILKVGCEGWAPWTGPEVHLNFYNSPHLFNVDTT